MHANTDNLRRALEHHGLKLRYDTPAREWHIAERDGALLCRASTARRICRLGRLMLARLILAPPLPSREPDHVDL